VVDQGVARVLEITSVETLFDIHPSLETAL
jgi:hypothetical protein